MRWTPIKEALPELGRDVIVWHDGRIHVGSLEYDDEFDENCWFIPTSGDWEDPEFWMDLPHPPGKKTERKYRCQ